MSDRVVAVVGATGAVGQEMLRVLAERRFPVRDLRAFASSRSAGSTVQFAGRPVTVRELDAHAFDGVDVALIETDGERVTLFGPSGYRAYADKERDLLRQALADGLDIRVNTAANAMTAVAEGAAVFAATQPLRAKARPTVSTPIEWEELEAALAAGDASRLVFDADQALRRVNEKGDLFAPLLSERQRLPESS